MSEWKLWIYNADVVNDGSNSGNHTYKIVVPVGTMMELLYVRIANDDTTDRTAFGYVDSGGTLLVYYMKRASLTAGDVRNFPVAESADDTAVAAGVKLMLGGGMNARAEVSSIAISQDSNCSFVAMITGTKPTVTITSPTDAVEVVAFDKVV